jgi:hypothetical protein
MLVRHKKPFNRGIILALSFLAVLALIFSPVFGGKNGLDYSDDLFNKLSKGSSYFIPKVSENAKKFAAEKLEVTVKLPKAEYVEKAVKMVIATGGQVGAKETEVKVNAEFGKLMDAVIKDSDAMYKNNGKEVAARYGFDESEVMTVWWNLLNPMVKDLQKQKKIEQANVVSEVLKKAIEPAFNFYGIEAQNVGDKAFTMIFLLSFYVAYTMWWGYAIYYLFEGIGLSMKKAKVKKEV